jgi:ABC-type phosphate transport system substrate-binding protein
MAATVGSAQSYTPNIQGGGATLPAPTYRQDFNCFGMPLTSPPDPTSDTYVPPECGSAAKPIARPIRIGAGYPIDATKIFRYSGVGSGRGQCMYLTHDVSYNNDASRPITEVDFAGSDAKLSADQINTFTNGGPLGTESSACAGVTIPAQAPIFGPLIMVPSLATPITLAISPDTAAALNILPATPAGGTSGLTFSRAGYCKVLTGQITDWSSGDSDFISQNIDSNGNPQPFSNTSIPLEVIYRTDGSGTTFLLTQHMTAIQSACGSSLYTGASQTMPAGLPANFAGANASEGVEAAILGPSNTGNIGYLSPDFTAQSTVMPLHPAVTANLINAAGNVQPPSPSATTAGMGDVAPPSGTNRQNQLNWVPLVEDPQNVNGYPIVGYTTQEYYTCYSLTSGVDVIANGLTGYLTWALSSPDGVPDQVLNDNGFAPLPPDWKNAILDTFITGIDGNNLQIRVGPVAGVCSSFSLHK